MRVKRSAQSEKCARQPMKAIVMQQKRVLISVWTVLAVLTVCNVTSAAAQQSLDGVWRIGTAPSGPTLMLRGTLLTGFTGCQSYSGEMTGQLERGRVQLGPLTQASSCTAAQLNTEREFLGKLLQTRAFSLKASRLEARNPSGQLQFMATRAVVSRHTKTIARSTDGVWQSNTFARSTFTLLGGQFSFQGQCQQSSGTVALGSLVRGTGSFAVFQSNSAAVFCANQASERSDQSFLAALSNASTYRIDGGVLSLLNRESQVILTFTLK
jgi:heat shock protein HslJ